MSKFGPKCRSSELSKLVKKLEKSGIYESNYGNEIGSLVENDLACLVLNRNERYLGC